VNGDSRLNKVGGKRRNANAKVKCAELREYTASPFPHRKRREKEKEKEKEKKKKKKRKGKRGGKGLCEEGYHTSRPKVGKKTEKSVSNFENNDCRQ